MIPSRAQVKSRFLGLLDDDAGKVFTETVFAQAFGEAYDALFTALLVGQVPRIKNIIVVVVAPGTTSLTPGSAGISDFADYQMLRERLTGSSELFRRLESRETLTQRTQADRLLEFVWRWDTFYFVGATTSRDLEITYESSGTAPTDDGSLIGVDSSLTFLANYSAGVAGQRKGYDEIADRCWKVAVGSRYNDGVIGGELFRLLQSKVRSEQKTQIAPRPFSTQRRNVPRMVPFIAAQQPQGVSTAPTQFSLSAGTITGTVDGSNSVFYLAYPVSSVVVILNGATLTPGLHYTFSANQLTFVAPYVPQAGADILVEGWL